MLAVKKSQKQLQFTLDDGTGKNCTIITAAMSIANPKSWWTKPASPSRIRPQKVRVKPSNI